MYNVDPYNVLLAIATNILQRLKTGFVLQARVPKLNSHLKYKNKKIL